MTTVKRWTVDIFIDEHDDERRTYAEARLHAGDRSGLRGIGRAHRHPGDPEVPEIGDEVAAARALTELSHRLLWVAAEDIRQASAGRVRVAG